MFAAGIRSGLCGRHSRTLSRGAALVRAAFPSTASCPLEEVAGRRWTDFANHPEGRIDRSACQGLLSLSSRVGPGLRGGLVAGTGTRAEVFIFERGPK